MAGEELRKVNMCDICGKPTYLAGGFAMKKDLETGESFNACFSCIPQDKGNRINQFERLAWRYGKGDIKLPRPDYKDVANRTARQMADPNIRNKMIKQLPLERQKVIFDKLSSPRGSKIPKGFRRNDTNR